MDVYDRDGKPIGDWRDWTRPKKDSQWRATRSAMELARAWFTSAAPTVPPEVDQLLSSHALTRGAVLREGWPEAVTSLPYSGEGRNHDLVLLGDVGPDRLLMTIEGKVDETMGPPVGSYWLRAKKTPRSNAWRRIDALLAAVFGTSAAATDEPWSGLPYQMLTAMVGTALEAHKRSCVLAVVCLHELVTESAKTELLARNERDFVTFMKALGEAAPRAGQLYGPFDVSLPSQPVVVPVFVGKAQYQWAAR